MKKVLILILCLALFALPVSASEENISDAGSPPAEAIDEAADSAGDEAVKSAGDEATDSAGDEAADSAGDEATDSAGDEAADSAGDEAADSAGDEAAESAGDEAADSEGDSADSEGDSGESEGGGGALSTSPGAPVIAIENDEIIVSEEIVPEYSENSIIEAAADGQPALVSGVQIYTSDLNAGGIAWNSDQDFIFGGEDDLFPVTTHFTGEELSFNSVVTLDLPEDFAWGVDTASGFAIEAAGQGTMTVENVYAQTTGVNRYSVHLSSGTTVIKDSYFESLGGRGEYCMMPWFTMQYGTSRNLVMTSLSSVYVYNSFCATEGFASWSTDMTNGNMFLYNADCENYNGGYGSFADGCTVNIYGSSFNSAEYGVFGCNGGKLVIGSSADALNATDSVFLENLAGEELEEDTPSVILGDRNAVIMHIVATMSDGDPERNGIVDTNTESNYNTQNILYATNSVFSTKDAIGTSQGKYPAPMAMYLDHMRGSVIEFRSSNADVRLENCELESATGILFQSVVNMDSTAIQILDDVTTESIPGICIVSEGNDWTGNISHEDYQRPMRLSLDDTTLTGAILAPGIEEWLALWKDYADIHYTQDPDTGLYVNDADPTDTGETYSAQDPNNIYLWATAITEYNAVRGVYLNMNSGSVWNVTETSNLRSLTVEAGATINGIVTVDGTEIDISAGGTWEGEIVVNPM